MELKMHGTNGRTTKVGTIGIGTKILPVGTIGMHGKIIRVLTTYPQTMTDHIYPTLIFPNLKAEKMNTRSTNTRF